MLQNLDKTEALENKSADLANQAKTCAASPTTPTRVLGHPRVSGRCTASPRASQVSQVRQGHKADDVQAEPQDEPHHRPRRRRLPYDHHHTHRHLRQQAPPSPSPSPSPLQLVSALGWPGLFGVLGIAMMGAAAVLRPAVAIEHAALSKLAKLAHKKAR